MNIAPVSIRMLLNPLTRPMAMKAPRHDASAAPSSERAEAAPAAAGGNRDGADLIQKTCYLQPLLHPPARAIVHQSTGQLVTRRQPPARTGILVFQRPAAP